jgi:hypothetical protein
MEITKFQSEREQKKTYVAININIYGDKSIQKQVGTSLSSAQMYLQHPDFLEDGCQYDNPHFVSIPNVQPNLPSSLPDRKKARTASKLSPEPESDRNDFQNEIAVVFNSLTRARCLKMLEADMRIKTKLLTYVYVLLLKVRSCQRQKSKHLIKSITRANKCTPATKRRH